MFLRPLAFVIAYLGAATAVSLPWMLGEEHTAACFTLDKEDLATPTGLFMRWKIQVPSNMRATTSSDIAYELVLSDNFWNATSNKVLLGSKFDFYRNACTAVNPDCTAANAAKCCVWHANVHSCLSSNFQCEPWVSATNGTNGTILATSTASQVGGAEIYRTGLMLPEGGWIIIAHVKVMTFQCAIGANRLVLPPSLPPPVVTDQELPVEIVAPIVVVAVVLMASLFGYIRFQKWLLKTQTRDVSLAPKTPEVALLFTDVQQSTMLWNTNREAMEKSIEVHHRTMRQVISRHRGYEVKTIGDSFFVVHSDPEVMLKLAFEAQRALLHAPWPVEILTTPDSCVEVDKNGMMIFKGLRVRMGIHFGPVNSVYDDISKGFDYYGDAVNTASRVESVAFGGQTLISDAVFVRVTAALKAFNAGHVLIGDVRLKGLAVAVKLHEVSLPDIPRVFEGVRESDVTSHSSLLVAQASAIGGVIPGLIGGVIPPSPRGSPTTEVKDVAFMSVMELRDEVVRSRAREEAARFQNEEDPTSLEKEE